MWRNRLHKYFHRCVGGSVVIVGLLTQVRDLDLSALLGEHYGGIAVAALGLAIVLLEFLPIIENVIHGDTPEQKDPA